ncbi:MAG: hypothetical protein PHS40_02415 [Mariniphaga sp.]|nr:hypothetical protein [Mariniphaga sp.]MDD4424759.1 hypothetical protein [Mariniphaga sp.]
MRVAVLIFFLLAGVQSFAQPGPGDLFREYIWLPKMAKEQGKFLRVGGRLDYKTSEAHFPADEHRNGYIPLLEDIDLQDAVKAEMVVEKLGSHEDTKNLRVSLNQQPFLVFPAAKGIPDPESDYMHHHYPVIQVPLEQLKEGAGNAFRFEVDQEQRWNWPQNIIYGVILRVYYKPENVAFKPVVRGVVDGGMLQDKQLLKLSDKNAGIYRVEYIGCYEDVNWEGDGIYDQWHYHYFRGRVVHNIGSSNMYPFDVVWNTSWIPDQDDIKVAARVTSNTGLIYFTEPVEDLKTDRNYSVELCKPYDQPKNWVTRQDEFTAKFDMETNPSQIGAAKAYWVSWSPCYSNGVFINGRKIYDRSELCYEYMAHEVDLVDPLILKKGTNIINSGKEPLHDGQMVHGMEVQWPGIMVKIRTRKEADFKVTVEAYEGRQHYKVVTPKITYYYDVKGGGFSRIIDDEGNDWVSFKMEPWDEYPGSAAGAFRGLPNFVFQGDDGGAGHPGHDKCKSWIEDKKIVTESLSGKWMWSWEFLDDHAVLEVLSVDTIRAYWFLYEGTPGGRFDPENTFFGTDISGPEKLTYNYSEGSVYRETFQWMYTGHRNVNNTFYLIQCNEDDFSDMISLLGNTEEGFDSPDGMTVFGFGRGEGVTRYLTGSNKFVIGMYPKTIQNKADHQELIEFIEDKYLEH